MKALAYNILSTLFVVGLALLAYDRQVARPAQRVGVVDLAEVYRVKEKEFTDRFSKAGNSEAERDKALAVARSFAERLPQALDELPGECRCLVLVRTALAANTPSTLDLTPALKQKVGIL